MHCRKEEIPEGSEFPKVWEWLSEPGTTKEEKTVNGTEYIVYTGHVSLQFSDAFIYNTVEPPIKDSLY